MKKNRVNEILVNQAKRRNTVLAFSWVILIVFVISLSFFLTYIERNKESYVTYDEDSIIDYKVLLKENDFFDDSYLGSNSQYIASLIDYINASFEYNLALNEKDVDFKYSYRIEADVNVTHKDVSQPLYNKTVELLKEKEINILHIFNQKINWRKRTPLNR